jgi:hypothetical protein
MRLHIPSMLLGGILFVVSTFVVTDAMAKPQITIPGSLTQGQKDVLDLLSVVYIDDCQGGPGYKTLRVSGANLQVTNGTGATFTTNGLGNLIVGYNEQNSQCDLSGSHNIVLGQENEYTTESFAGLIGGKENIILSEYNLVFGQQNAAYDPYASVIGGTFQVVHNIFGVIVGGASNSIDAEGAVIVGGEFNTATGTYGVLGGGQSRSVNGPHDWVAGSLFEDF